MSALIFRRISSDRTCCQSMRCINLIRNRKITCSSARRSEEKLKTESVEKQENDSTSEDAMIVKDSKNELVEQTEKKRMRSPMQYMKDSHREIVSTASIGDYSYPHNLDKVALMWANYYDKPEDIPAFLPIQRAIYANDKMRVVIMYWIMSTCFFFLMTMMYLGSRRVKQYHGMITEKQNKVWAAKSAAYHQ